MDYVRKLVGADEKLIGIVHLHWIYVLRGALWLLGYSMFGIFLHAVIVRALAAAAAVVHSPRALMPIAVLDDYSEGATFALGAAIFAFYCIKYISTEIGLTNRRLIRKSGMMFVHVHEVDLEEIHAETLDLGYLGKLLGYGFIKLDCRFVGDVTTPAIEKPELFMRALHKARSQVTDSAAMIATKPSAEMPIHDDPPAQRPNAAASPSTPHPTAPAPVMPELDPAPTAPAVQAAAAPVPVQIQAPVSPMPGAGAHPMQSHATPTAAPVPAAQTLKTVAAPVMRETQTETPELLAVAPQTQMEEQPAMPVPVAIPAETAPVVNAARGIPPQSAAITPAAILDPAAVAKIVAAVVPQVVQQVTEQMSAQQDAAVPPVRANLVNDAVINDFEKAVDSKAIH